MVLSVAPKTKPSRPERKRSCPGELGSRVQGGVGAEEEAADVEAAALVEAVALVEAAAAVEELAALAVAGRGPTLVLWPPPSALSLLLIGTMPPAVSSPRLRPWLRLRLVL